MTKITGARFHETKINAIVRALEIDEEFTVIKIKPVTKPLSSGRIPLDLYDVEFNEPIDVGISGDRVLFLEMGLELYMSHDNNPYRVIIKDLEHMAWR